MTIPSVPTQPGHIVVVPFEAWGHVRPLLHLTIQLLALHPTLHITHLLSPAVALRITAELASSNFAHTKDNSDILARMQLVEVEIAPFATPDKDGSGEPEQENGHATDHSLVLDMAAKGAAYAKAIAAYFGVLFGAGDAGFENKFKDIQPSCVIFDMFQPFAPEVVHQVTTAMGIPMVPAFMFVPSGPTSMIPQLAKEEDGGFVASLPRVIAEGLARGDDPLKVLGPLGMGDKGAIKSLPGLPTMTDYELHPGLGSCPPPPQIMLLFLNIYEAAWSAHQTGFVAVNVEEMEIEAKHWIEKSMGKPFLSLGFQYSENVWKGNVAPPAAEDSDGLKSIAFLDEMLKVRGPKSVIYVSFGSAWFPFLRPDLVHHLLDTLISTSTPFLFAYATEIFPVPSDLLDRVKGAEFGLAVHIAPQVQVLNHAATGFFVSHCGGNSMAEAIVASVPIIAMPFGADQGEHSEILKKYNAAIDLKQVKCFIGVGEKPTVLYDGTKLVGTEEAIKAEMVDLWGQLKGGLGVKLYKGMQELHELCKKSCGGGGISRQAMLDFSKYF